MHEDRVELKVVSIKVKLSLTWVFSSVKYFAASLELVVVHTESDLPSFEFAVEGSFTVSAGGAAEGFEFMSLPKD